jgi:hypothetical protein
LKWVSGTQNVPFAAFCLLGLCRPKLIEFGSHDEINLIFTQFLTSSGETILSQFKSDEIYTVSKNELFVLLDDWSETLPMSYFGEN